jgi:uncharacterized RDD family membrane protein YckC
MPSQPSPGGEWQPPGQPHGAAQGPPPGQPQGTPGQTYGTPGQTYGTPGQPYGVAPGQPPGTPGQPYGAYQAYPGSAAGTGYRVKDPALAEWWQRLLARIIDGIIVGILVSPFWIPLMVSVFHRVQRLSNQYPDLTQPAAQQAFNSAVRQMVAGMVGTYLLVGLAGALIYFGYDWLQHGLWGQTIGKRALGTKVVTAQGHAPITGNSACGRAAVFALVPAVPSVGGLFFLLDSLWLTWDPRRQCLHDKAASTVVVKTSMLAPSATPPPGTAQPFTPYQS